MENINQQNSCFGIVLPAASVVSSFSSQGLLPFPPHISPEYQASSILQAMECTNCQKKKRCSLHATTKIANRLTPGAACSRCKAQKKKCGPSCTRSDRRPNKNLSQGSQKDQVISQGKGGEGYMHTGLQNPSCLPPIFPQELQISALSLPQILFMSYISPNSSPPSSALNTASSEKLSTASPWQSSNRVPICLENASIDVAEIRNIFSENSFLIQESGYVHIRNCCT